MRIMQVFGYAANGLLFGASMLYITFLSHCVGVSKETVGLYTVGWFLIVSIY